MGLIAILVFVAAFAVITPIALMLGGGTKAEEKKQSAAALDTALGTQTVDASGAVIDFRKSEHLSSIPLLNRYLAKVDLVPRLRRFLAQAELKWTPATLILLTLICFGAPAYLVDLRTGSMLVGLGVGVATAGIPFGYVYFMRSRRFGKFEQGLPEALDLMVSALRVGHSFNSALGLVTRECQAPVGPEFRIAFEEQNFGLDLRTALENLTTRVPLQDLRIAVTAILIQRESGGNLAEVLEKTANVIRQRFKLKKQVMVHTAQGRMTGLVLTILPIALGVGLYIVNPTTMRLLWTRDIGIKLIWAGIVSLILGTAVIQKIVRMEV
jgi:tight adherence protein B